MMNNSTADQVKLGQILQTNKLAIFLEILLVFLPFILGIVTNNQIANDRIPLGGGLFILGGSITYLGLLISLGLLWVVTRLRGASWPYFGLYRPKSWLLTMLQSLGISLVVFLAVRFIINPIMATLPNAAYQDLSRFDYLNGDLPNLIIMLIIIWITAAFLEEFLFRGYLMNRLIDLQGKQTILAWTAAVVVQAIIFGFVHAYQSPAGMIKVGLIGLLFGISYLVTGRNLWPVILAHGLIDSLDMIGHYFGT
jgi:hypothetical protein